MVLCNISHFFHFSIVHQQNGFDARWHKVAKCLLKNWLFLSTDSFICYKTWKSGWFKHILLLCFWVSSHQSPTSKDVVVQCDYCYICGLLLWEEWGWCHLRQIGPSNISLHISHHIFLFNKHALPFAPILNLYIYYSLHTTQECFLHILLMLFYRQRSKIDRLF